MRIGVFIGRLQPFHRGHEHVVREALKQVDKLVILIGSAGAARSDRNPWTFDERREMIKRCFPWEVSNDKIVFQPIHDHPSDERWITDVRNAVAMETNDPGKDEVLLVGFSKDQSSFYLKLFPDWSSVDIAPKHRVLSATPIRESYFSYVGGIQTQLLPEAVAAFLEEWNITDAYYQVFYETEAIKRYKDSWKPAPFPPTFITADAIVVQSGHILLVRRGDYPGKGLLALPGGFINQFERIRDAAARELKEETEIEDGRGRIPAGRLQTYITETKVFDNPYRSSRGRTVTHAHLFRLPDAKPLWKVTGSDDAASAEWRSIANLSEDEMFEDHFHIIQDMLGL
ncbi:bifunctional nicotinamide-nucleotide adenylyltransferase/Nudix hydroxylase [Mesorhizobium sp. M8A.F.Ca.ET.021.01.1.1]|uniref:bifunctional nicotinamide-nucleotide adenylyltransferase/Nudix hydroxylase n=1 Tax=Mesorhizobium sp. M8A.F.Ca.ET.021.01.1.1 TaxID=2496757 RepID=UPI000FCCDA2C|nr:bifunctional nicotinamide-nucleotide adenylyltransferase/Nudix hydroxylase [Mesorhizobium sp. M8A.F.Ca.ET.021.01.1.1]RUW57173.1 NUDIX domain-containing protein [Mesorhizobium sp. M8A.F.Ca.ET.021.01.1.1]